MGFNRNTARNNNQGENDAWKSAGFINIYLPSKKEGKPRKLGAIGLREGNVNEKELCDWLKADPSRVKKLLGSLVLEFRSAEPAEGSGFALPEDEPAPAGAE